MLRRQHGRAASDGTTVRYMLRLGGLANTGLCTNHLTGGPTMQQSTGINEQTIPSSGCLDLPQCMT